MLQRFILATLLALPLLHVSCRKPSVETYRVPKEKEAAAVTASMPATNGAPGATPEMNAMANTPVATAEGSALTWSAPAEWKQKSASSMRKGSYTVPGDDSASADLAITAFPGDVGGELANVNRWRGQVQLPPISEPELQIERREHNGLRFAIVDITGPGQPAQRILGASVPVGNATWFFKLMGPSPVVEKAKPAFLEFLKTVKRNESATQ